LFPLGDAISIAMKNNISPEERLFNAIQEGKKIPDRKGSVKSGLSGLKNIWQKIETMLAGQMMASEVEGDEPRVNIKVINTVLYVILAVLIGGVGYEIIYARAKEAKIAEIVPVKQPASVVRAEPVEDFKPLETYLEDIKKKDIFHPLAPEPVAPVAVKETVPVVPAGPRINELMKDLSLAGIYEGEHAEVMIEDKVQKKTYFLKEGDEIKGMKIKTILKDRVTLQLGTEEADLL
jgi:hypothetical protein